MSAKQIRRKLSKGGDKVEKLLTTKEIADMYDVSPYTITQNWCNKGLKFIRGKGGMLFKVKWIEEFLEEESERQSQNRNTNKMKIVVINKTIKSKKKINFNKEMKIV